MGKFIRILVSILVILSFVLLARNNTVWAADREKDSSQSIEQSISPEGGKHCNDDDKNESEDCEDDRGERDDEDDDDGDDDDDGTVKPPRHRVKVCKLGTFSVGGVATIQIQRLGRRDCVTAFLAPYKPGSDPRLPTGSTALTDVLSVKLPKKNASVKICFAVPPGNDASIYTISRRAWVAVGSGQQGTVCTETSRSGTFILLRQ